MMNQGKAADKKTKPKRAARKKKTEGADGEVDEQRIRFLERNRAAATRCRERKKQWMQELHQRASTLSVANAQMTSEITRLKDEVSQLKSYLLAQGGPAALEGLSALSGLQKLNPIEGKSEGNGAGETTEAVSATIDTSTTSILPGKK